MYHTKKFYQITNKILNSGILPTIDVIWNRGLGNLICNNPSPTHIQFPFINLAMHNLKSRTATALNFSLVIAVVGYAVMRIAIGGGFLHMTMMW